MIFIDNILRIAYNETLSFTFGEQRRDVMKKIMLSRLREQRNLTQRQLAIELGIAPSSIAMYETGARSPSLKKARYIATYFGVAVDEIIFGSYVRKA